ncbi:protein of unknown function [Magnetospira sp. QH-2]|nr:protein of unknown function [Magnetospira sp. QH-2]
MGSESRWGLLWAKQSGEKNQAVAYALLTRGRDSSVLGVEEALAQLEANLTTAQRNFAGYLVKEETIFPLYFEPDDAIESVFRKDR